MTKQGNSIECGDCVPVMRGMKTASVDLVIGSPPYAGKGRRYGGAESLPADKWIAMMLDATIEAGRVAKNVVVWVVNGYVRDSNYHPACEGLVYEAYKAGLRCERPVIWHKNAPPNRKNWFGNDWEFCLAFRPFHSVNYFDGSSIATPPKYASGGRFRQRTATGKRRMGGAYPTGKLTHPRDVLRVTVGGGHMGSKLAHASVAPYPEKLIEPFVKVLCPPGGTVLDPFCGSGTSLVVAERLGRKWIGIDSDPDMITLSYARLEEYRTSCK